MKQIFSYLNPIARLGVRKYSVVFPVVMVATLSVLSELFAKVIVQDTSVVGVYGIFLFVLVIIYFAFRDGIVGGVMASVVTIGYYAYIILDRDSSNVEKMEQWKLVLTLALTYFLLAGIIGWLKQTIDRLIEQEAEQKIRLESIIDQLPVGVVVTDERGQVVRGNKQMEKLLGRPIKEDALVGRDTWNEAKYQGKPLKPEDWPIAKALKTGKSVGGKVIVIERDDGSKVHLQVSASVIRNTEEKIIAAATILNDITRQKELEERKDDFINMASHELKTPLTSMKLYIDSLARRIKRDEDLKTGNMINGIKLQTVRLQELVNDLLDVSRLQTGKLALNTEVFDLTAQLKSTIEGLQPMIKQKINFSGEKVYKVMADQFRIDQVITNLLTNAAKYSPTNQVINVWMEEEGTNVVAKVQDFGIGVAKNQQGKIFDRLYQVTDAHEKTFPGLGMGLYISKEIIKRHKGKIGVSSKKGKGSTFYFSLPLVTK